MQGLDPGRARALEAKIRVLNGQLEKARAEALALGEFETSLNQLQRKRDLDENNYRHFAAGLEQARFDEALGSGKLANISIVQTPSPPALDSTKRLKTSAMALVAGLLGGIGLALLIEFALDQTVRRPVQLESTLGLPLFVTIPKVNGGQPMLMAPKANGVAATSEKEEGTDVSIPGWSHEHPLRSHIIALRDRTLMHFETDTHKPKLIGVTSCRDGVGVTTIASALAAALSETGEGRVLLVNLNFAEQSLHPFLRGQSVCSLVDAMAEDKRETALIGHNLYLAAGRRNANGSAEGSTSMSRLVPKLKVSDYDYIVFDMPCVNRTSITSKMAGMMDLVFMVVESEVDSQDFLKRACQLLGESNAKFSIVLNKFRSYAPTWLHQEL
jgi:Mrp family chromosome partitioning ATPase